MKKLVLCSLCICLLSACAKNPSSGQVEVSSIQNPDDIQSLKAEIQLLQQTVLDQGLQLTALRDASINDMNKNSQPPVPRPKPQPKPEVKETIPPPAPKVVDAVEHVVETPPTINEIPEPKIVKMEDELSQKPLAENKPKTQTPPTPKQPAVSSENQTYQTALGYYRTARFDNAISAFDEFLQKYPSSNLVANAFYWKGESYYAQGEFTESILVFKDIIARFPRSSKSADALLKIAMAYDRLGDTANSALYATVLYEDWPNTEASKKARALNLQGASL